MKPSEHETQGKRTYAEIAQELGITPSAVRKIEQRALRKLHRALKQKGYKRGDFF